MIQLGAEFDVAFNHAAEPILVRALIASAHATQAGDAKRDFAKPDFARSGFTKPGFVKPGFAKSGFNVREL